MIDGVNAIAEDTEIADFGIISTPILHYLVVCKNDGGVYGEPSVDGYCNKLVEAYKKIIGNVTIHKYS